MTGPDIIMYAYPLIYVYGSMSIIIKFDDHCSFDLALPQNMIRDGFNHPHMTSSDSIPGACHQNLMKLKTRAWHIILIFSSGKA